MGSSPESKLRTALKSLPEGADDAVSGELQDRVCAYVDEMRQRQLPPEKILAELKQIAREAGLRPVTSTGSGKDQEPEGLVIQQLVRWCIDHYYTRPGNDSPSPRP